MRGLKINKQSKRPDTPLAATPEPKLLSAVKEKLPSSKSKKDNNGGYAEGVGTLRANGGDLGGGSENLVVHKG